MYQESDAEIARKIHEEWVRELKSPQLRSQSIAVPSLEGEILPPLLPEQYVEISLIQPDIHYPWLCRKMLEFPGAEEAILRAYGRDPRAVEKALLHSCISRTRYSFGGRAKHKLLATRLLGIILAGNSQIVDSVIREIVPDLYSAIHKSHAIRGFVFSLDLYLFSRRHATLTLGEVTMAMVLSHILKLKPCDLLDADETTVSDLLLEIAFYYEIDYRDYRANVERKTIKKVFKKTDKVGFRDLFSRVGDLDTVDTEIDPAERALFNSVCSIMARYGIEPPFYLRGIHLDHDDLAQAIEAETMPYVNALSILLAKGILEDHLEGRSLPPYNRRLIEEARKAQEDEEGQATRVGRLEADNLQLKNMAEALTQKLAKAETALGKARGKIDSYVGIDEEIASLRNALYRAQEKDSDALPADTEPRRELPEGLVCLGGHENWIREMKLLVPGVTWLSHEVSWADDQVRNASELWINPKHLNHSSFWRAVGIARKHRVPVRYFSSLSVHTCVREIHGA